MLVEYDRQSNKINFLPKFTSKIVGVLPIKNTPFIAVKLFNKEVVVIHKQTYLV